MQYPVQIKHFPANNGNASNYESCSFNKREMTQIDMSNQNQSNQTDDNAERKHSSVYENHGDKILIEDGAHDHERPIDIVNIENNI